MRSLRIAVVLAVLSMCSCSRRPSAADPPPATYRLQSFTLNDSAPETIQGASVTAAFLPAKKAQPLLGRLFLPAEYQAGAKSVVLVSNRLWKRKFGDDPALIGRTLRFNDRNFTVIGIMPATFESSASAEIWVPAEN